MSWSGHEGALTVVPPRVPGRPIPAVFFAVRG